MSFVNYSTLTSGIVRLKLEDFEVEHFNTAKISNKYANKILVLENNSGAVSDYDFAVKAMCEAGFRIVIASDFPDVFNAKALNAGLYPIEITQDFIEKMFVEYNMQSRLKLFIDIVGQEIMMVKTGEKVYFKTSDYNRECLLNGYNDVDYIYCVYDDINCIEKSDCENELTVYAIE
jgi:3-isopropylmalate/(R)-2-methylmalate dehydratase small subunit